MASRKEVEEAVKEIIKRVDELGPELLDEWGGSVQMSFADINTSWFFKFSMDGRIEEYGEEDRSNEVEAVAHMDSDTFVGMVNGTINPMEAFYTGTIKVDGAVDALLKMAPILIP